MAKSSFLVGLVIPLVTAAPQYTPDMMGYTFFCPVVDSVENITGDPWQAGASGAGGAEMQLTKGHTVGTAWAIGGGLGLSVGEIISVDGGLSGSVSETVEDSVEEAVTLTCPSGDWHCSILVYPGVTHVKGHMKEMKSDDSCPSGTKTNYDNVSDGDKYELTIPRKDEAGNGYWEPVVCTCKNSDHWADNGHPEDFCKEDCALSGH
ncbi:hypothetical protein F4804DRAFT_350147 [Jackrogersella minutella]|nr:hypothetical protein F4804DRAFT_350147 [Jackrogersella minutella]